MKTELKAHELRIGNLFYYDERIQIVEGVSIKNGGYRIDFKTEGKSKLVENCKPIPINEELWSIIKNDELVLVDKVGFVIFKNGYAYQFVFADYEYLHEFQNLYFWITKKELELNLFS